MCSVKEVSEMLPYRRSRIQIITTVSLCLIVLVFIFYQIIASSHFFWSSRAEVDNEPVFLGSDATVKIFKEVIEHPKSEAFIGEKWIHLDLKGAPPLVSYYKDFFPYIRKLGATGVVIEYEDMFFYKDELEDIRATNAYQPHEIRKIQELATNSNLVVVPLIQTFGHFEFVLKLYKYKGLREISTYPQVLCPSHDKAQSLIKRMIDQVLEAHPNAKYIHIGSDEVMHLGQCNKCQAVMQDLGWSNAELFLSHVKKIALYINKTYPNVRPIIWGDMIAKFDEGLIIKSGISNFVDVMVWKYIPDVSSDITDDLLAMYARVFKTIWIASAFKGATGVNKIITDITYHLENHMAWMKIVSKWENSINFKGILLTGWQRYDHFTGLCELLPVGLPSLTINLSYLNGSEKGTRYRDVLKTLQCDAPFSFTPFTYTDTNSKFGQCHFPGSKVYQLVNTFYTLSKRITEHFSLDFGWFTFYHILHKFSSPFYVEGVFSNWPVNEHLRKLKVLEEELRGALSQVYDNYTVEEWITSHVTPIRILVEAFCNAKDSLLSQTVWPRRPLLDNAEAVEKAAREICTSEREFGCALLLT